MESVRRLKIFLGKATWCQPLSSHMQGWPAAMVAASPAQAIVIPDNTPPAAEASKTDLPQPQANGVPTAPALPGNGYHDLVGNGGALPAQNTSTVQWSSVEGLTWVDQQQQQQQDSPLNSSAVLPMAFLLCSAWLWLKNVFCKLQHFLPFMSSVRRCLCSCTDLAADIFHFECIYLVWLLIVRDTFSEQNSCSGQIKQLILKYQQFDDWHDWWKIWHHPLISSCYNALWKDLLGTQLVHITTEKHIKQKSSMLFLYNHSNLFYQIN